MATCTPFIGKFLCLLQVSSYQRSLEDCLRSLGLSFQQEVDLSGLLVDVFIHSKNLIIELDGPTHFVRNSLQLLGPTAFKHRMLRAMGFNLLSITLEDWDDLIDMRAQRAFLQAAMARRLWSAWWSLTKISCIVQCQHFKKTWEYEYRACCGIIMKPFLGCSSWSRGEMHVLSQNNRAPLYNTANAVVLIGWYWWILNTNVLHTDQQLQWNTSFSLRLKYEQ